MNDKKKSIDWKKWFRTALPFWITIALGEVVLLATYLGPFPAVWKMAAFFAVPFIIVAVALLFQGVCKWVNVFECFVCRNLKAIFTAKRNWKRIILYFGCTIAAGLLMERILTYIAKGSLTANFGIRRFIWAWAICLLTGFGIFFWKYLKTKVHLVAFLTILLVGTVYATVLPISTGMVWDDNVHYPRTYSFAHDLSAKKTVQDMVVTNAFNSTVSHEYLYDEASHEEWIARIDPDDPKHPYLGGAYIMPTPERICYMPAAVMMDIGWALKLPFHIIFIMGRWTNLLIYAILIAFAIYKLKSGKMLLFAVAMLPPVVLMASSYSRDAWMVGFVALAFSTIMGEIQSPDTKIKNTTLWLIVISMFLGIAVKAVFLPIMLIGLTIPKNKFQSKRQRRLYIWGTIIAMLILLATFAIPYLTVSGAYSDTRGGETVDSGSQTAFMLSNPLGYLGILFRFLGEYFSLDNAKEYICWNGYLGKGPGALFIMIFMAVLTFVDADWDIDKNVKWLPRLTTLVMCFGAIVLAATSMYIAFSPVGSETIKGCQYRYLFPVFFLALFCFRPPVKNRVPKGVYHAVCMGLPTALALITIWQQYIMSY